MQKLDLKCKKTRFKMKKLDFKRQKLDFESQKLDFPAFYWSGFKCICAKKKATRCNLSLIGLGRCSTRT